MLQLQVELITKIKSRVGIFLQKFHLNGSSGSFVRNSLMSRWGETLVEKFLLAI